MNMKKTMRIIPSITGINVSVDKEWVVEATGYIAKEADSIHIRKSDIIMVYIEGANMRAGTPPRATQIRLRLTTGISIIFESTIEDEHANITESTDCQKYNIAVPSSQLGDLFVALKSIGF